MLYVFVFFRILHEDAGLKMTSLKTECRKFSPNIFNKSKCQNCFRGKDAHSSEALESNRVSLFFLFLDYLYISAVEFFRIACCYYFLYRHFHLDPIAFFYFLLTCFYSSQISLPEVILRACIY